MLILDKRELVYQHQISIFRAIEVMILSIAKEIERAIQNNEIEANKLSEDTAIYLRTLLKKKYCVNSKDGFLWDSFNECCNISDVNGWRRIAEFVGERNCIMFLEENEDTNFYEFENGQELNKLLADTYGFEFYITNEATDYLICFNHHDILYGCGTAKVWISKLN